MIREQAEAELAVLEARINGQLLLVEEGSKEELDLQKSLIDARRELELEAAGEDEKLRQAIILTANNEKAALNKAYYESQAQISKDNAAQLNEIEKAKNADLKKQRDEELADIKAKEAAKKQLTQDTVDAILNLGRQLLGESKGFALIEILRASAIGIANAVKAGAGLPFPANIPAIATGISAVAAGIAQAKSVLSQADQTATGSGGAGAVRGSLGSSNTIQVPDGLGSFNEDNVGVGVLSSGINSGIIASNDQADRVGETLAANIPEIYVAVTDINKAQNAREVKLTESRIGG